MKQLLPGEIVEVIIDPIRGKATLWSHHVGKGADHYTVGEVFTGDVALVVTTWGFDCDEAFVIVSGRLGWVDARFLEKV